MEYEPLECWAFAWSHSKAPFITRIVGYTRRECIASAEVCLGLDWKKIYRNGGRAVKCAIAPRMMALISSPQPSLTQTESNNQRKDV
jgi:hypothetical protein